MEVDVSLPMEGVFKLYRQGRDPYQVRIDENGLTLSTGGNNNERKEEVKASDLVGCVCMKAPPEEVQAYSAFFTVFAYPLYDNKRKRRTLCFQVTHEDNFEGNFEIAMKWRTAIHQARRKHGVSEPHLDYNQKLLVLINPNSGSGKAHQKYKRYVAAVFGEAEVQHKVIVTERANHAKELVTKLDLTSCSGLVIISGDGLLYEVYNGLLKRPDWEQAIQFPVGIIPGGSGNGLARSIAHWLSEPYMASPVLVSTLNIVHGHFSPMDLVLLETAAGKRLLSFLSVGFGIISDIDIESERLRIIGESRFAVWAVARVANLRRYHARIYFKRATSVSTTSGQRRRKPLLERSQTLEEDLKQSQASNTIHNSRSVDLQDSELRDSFLDPSLSLVKDEPLQPDHACDNLGENISSEDNRNNLEAKLSDEEEVDNCERSCFTIPPLDQKVPEDWEVMEDKFIMMYGSYQSYIGSDVFISPDSTPDDGCIYLIIIKGNTPKSTIARLLLGIDGSHVNLPGVEYIPVEALRIEPLCPKGNMTVDGEVVPWAPLQCQVLAKKGCILTR
ncbi:hypothetical protein Pmani_022066 [Petrolisthes manimaculis]|uniref:sphingosine kinase n=1 Tax=Petrolisthes manimaculis TaxID=1843537 RepID=A0AAE1PEX4_9EUCA|nr:hypothetical protein Pmani_022066 [Petrolisthes manimaculis]